MSNFTLPSDLRRGIANFVTDVSGNDIAERAEIISQSYNNAIPSRRVIGSSTDIAAYVTTRMPATYAATSAALSALATRAPSLAPLSVLDVGSGPGTASWAAVERWPSVESISMVDENEAMLSAARKLCDGAGHKALGAAHIDRAMIPGGLAQDAYDLVVVSYIIGELAPGDMQEALEALWRSAVRALVIVEPGTPEGFARIHSARDILITAGAEIAAPCPHAGPCPMRSPDWCHFGQQLARSRDHMRAKGAKLPFEVEKFSYLALTRGVLLETAEARIIDRPRAEKFGVTLRLCGETEISERLVLKRDKPGYRDAAHKNWGDSLPC